MSTFFAHWWMRMALNHALKGGICSLNVRTGVIFARLSPAVRPAVGFATIGSRQAVSSGRSALALPM